MMGYLAQHWYEGEGLGSASSPYARPCCLSKEGLSPSKEGVGNGKEEVGRQEKGRDGELGLVYKNVKANFLIKNNLKNT